MKRVQWSGRLSFRPPSHWDQEHEDQMLERRTRKVSAWQFFPLEGDQAKIGAGAGPTALLVIALVGAILFRIYLLIANDFPVNDGALFVEFVRATAATFPSLPAHATYNGLVLPFAYPPLSFWIGALSTKLGFDSLAVVRFLPILFNVVYVLLFAALLLKSGRSRLFTALAILFLSVNLRSFEWLLMGGGLTRGLGSVFLMLTLLAIGIPDRKDAAEIGLKRLVLSGIAVAGAILSHLEWGILAAASVVLSRALGSRTIRDFVASCLISGITAIILVLPWLSFVIGTHGLEPFSAAGETSGWATGFIKGKLLGIASLAVVSNPLVMLGGVALLFRRQWFWVAFILMCIVLTPRHAQTPAMLAIVVFGTQGVITAYHLADRFLRSRALAVTSAAVAVTAVLAFNVYGTVLYAPTSFRVLPPEMRAAMAWVAETQPGRSFAVVNDRAWPNDSTGEWLPTLTSGRSVTTVQGREWNREHAQYEDLTKALRKSGSCHEVRSNLRPFGHFDFIWVETMKECFEAPGYQRVFRNRLVSIYGSVSPVGQAHQNRPHR